MYDPLIYPYERVQNYTDGGLPKVLSDEFYNPTQDFIAKLYGSAVGQSCSIRTEEFDRESGGIVKSGMFGTQLNISACFNAKAYSTTALSPGEHGIWHVAVDTKGVFDFVAQDNTCFIGVLPFIWTAKVKLSSRVRLDTVANEGFLIGLNGTFTGLPSFIAGKDKANWQAFVGTKFFDTGIPVVDSAWIWMHITRMVDGTVRFYLKDNALPAKLVASEPFPGSLTSCRRFVRMHDSAGLALANDFFQIDMFARGIDR